MRREAAQRRGLSERVVLAAGLPVTTSAGVVVVLGGDVGAMEAVAVALDVQLAVAVAISAAAGGDTTVIVPAAKPLLPENRDLR